MEYAMNSMHCVEAIHIFMRRILALAFRLQMVNRTGVNIPPPQLSMRTKPSSIFFHHKPPHFHHPHSPSQHGKSTSSAVILNSKPTNLQAATTTKQRLALAIIDFLNTSLKDGTLSSEDAESIEIAQNCISECFKVDASDKDAMSAAIGGQSLLQIYGVYEKLKGKTPAGPGTNAAGEKAASASPSASSSTPTDAQKKDAESLKSQGNFAMAAKNYPAAIDLYTKALALVPGNPIFLSNRAAAYSASKDHESAQADAEAAVAADPKYTKAWSRLGLARFALGDAKGSMEAYQKGIEYEGNGGSEAMKKGFETAKKRVAELEAEGADDEELDRGMGGGGMGAGGAGGMPDLSALAGMFGGGGGAGGEGGGMPDLSSIMSNPMFASMAQNLMSNPEALNNLMSNPRIREMANQFGGGGGGGGGGGMPDLSSMMQDPSIAEM
jgi:small glutamine-rich tetratricopeptide repeat-containing protein alpha